MTVSEFKNNHIVYDATTDEPIVHSLAIINAAPGKECENMCAIFRVPRSSAMMRDTPDSEYVSFIADKDGISSYWIGDAYDPAKKVKKIYYPEIVDIMDDLFGEFPEFRDRLYGKIKEEFDSNELYKALGMGVIHEDS